MLHSIICDLWAVSLIHYNTVFIVLRQDMPALLWPHLLLLLHVWLNYPLLTAVGGWSHDLIADIYLLWHSENSISHNGFSEGDEIGRGDMLSRFADSLFFYALHHNNAMSPTHHWCSHTHVMSMHRCRRALIRIVRACARQLECRGSVQLLVPWFRGNRLQNKFVWCTHQNFISACSYCQKPVHVYASLQTCSFCWPTWCLRYPSTCTHTPCMWSLVYY